MRHLLLDYLLIVVDISSCLVGGHTADNSGKTAEWRNIAGFRSSSLVGGQTSDTSGDTDLEGNLKG